MSTLTTCPYCTASTEIESEDYPENDGDEMTVECPDCEELFFATLSVSIDFDIRCTEYKHDFQDQYKDGKYPELEKHLWCQNEGCDASKPKLT